jgi:hypothetical protein
MESGMDICHIKELQGYITTFCFIRISKLKLKGIKSLADRLKGQ